MTFFLHSAAAKIACLRQELGLSPEHLAQLVGVPQQTIDAWELGTEDVPAEVWSSLDRLLHSSALHTQTSN